jgi:hypothetical protein
VAISSYRLAASLTLAAAAAALAAPAFAHHSAAMFDNGKTVTITGAVKAFKWVNPHASIEVVSMEGGTQKVWAIECSTPNILVRRGWSIHSLKPGDMVTLQAHPMRDGGQAALAMTVTTPGGAVLKDHDY